MRRGKNVTVVVSHRLSAPQMLLGTANSLALTKTAASAAAAKIVAVRRTAATTCSSNCIEVRFVVPLQKTLIVNGLFGPKLFCNLCSANVAGKSVSN